MREHLPLHLCHESRMTPHPSPVAILYLLDATLLLVCFSCLI